MTITSETEMSEHLDKPLPTVKLRKPVRHSEPLRTGRIGDMYPVDEVMKEKRKKHLAEEAARKVARSKERPGFKLRDQSWEDLPEEVLAEIMLAYRALDYTSRLVVIGMHECVRHFDAREQDELWEAASILAQYVEEWLSANEVLDEVMVKHGVVEPNRSCAPFLTPVRVNRNIYRFDWTEFHPMFAF